MTHLRSRCRMPPLSNASLLYRKKKESDANIVFRLWSQRWPRIPVTSSATLGLTIVTSDSYLGS
jgi:hypothetical protein